MNLSEKSLWGRYPLLKTVIKCFSVLIVILLSFSLSYPQEKRPYGLSFNADNFEPLKNTSLDLFPRKPFHFDRSFILSAEISFWNSRKYGYIFKASDLKGLDVSLLYESRHASDSACLNLVINRSDIVLKIPVLKKELPYDKWVPLSLFFDLESHKIAVSICGRKYWSPYLKCLQETDLHMIFGTARTKDYFAGDTPGMALRNVRISAAGGKDLYFWPLDEYEGNIAYDGIEDAEAEVLYPAWILASHFKWKPLTHFLGKGFIQDVYDPNRQRVIFTDRYCLFEYNIPEKKLARIPYANHRPFTADYPVFSRFNNTLYIYYGGQGEVSVYNEKERTWTPIDTTKDFETHYYYHANFINPVNNDIMMVGGYGWFTVKNHIQRYNFKTKKWEKVKVKGDYFVPRQAPTSGEGYTENEVLIYGGTGNESGDQKVEFRHLYDLYSLDLRDFTIRKKWELKDVKVPFSIFFSSKLIYNKKENCIYGIGAFQPYDHGHKFQIFRFEADRPQYRTVTDPLPVINEKTGNAFLFYNDSTSEFIAGTYSQAGKDSVLVHVYSIKYPLLDRNEVIAGHRLTRKAMAEGRRKMIILSSLILTAGAMAGIKRKSLMRAAEKLKRKNKGLSEGMNEYLPAMENLSPDSILLFGGLRITDRKGSEISNKLQPRLAQIFILLFMHTYFYKRGITTEKFTDMIWPDLPPQSAKNNRGVSINKLRSFFQDVDGVDIVYTDHLWKVTLASPLYCDYTAAGRLMEKPAGSCTREEVYKIINILKSGPLLDNMSTEWLDPVKAQVNRELIRFLLQAVENVKTDEDPDYVYDTACAVSGIDSVNEDALKLKLKVHRVKKNAAQCLADFENFTAEYKKLYDKDYPNTIESLMP